MGLGFAEVVFRFECPGHFLGRATADRPEAEVVGRPSEAPFDGKGLFHTVHLLGSDEDRDALVAAFGQADVPVRLVGQGLRFTTVRVEGAEAGRALMAPFATVLKSLGEDVQFGPFVVSEGVFVGHVAVPDPADPADDGDVVRRLREGAEASDWGDWSLVRLTEFNPGGLARHLREDKLSTKQLEVVKMGLALGFYDSPRGCTLETLADLFGISKAAVHNRLKAAERKIIAGYFS